jgi:hypothetical protein
MRKPGRISQRIASLSPCARLAFALCGLVGVAARIQYCTVSNATFARRDCHTVAVR